MDINDLQDDKVAVRQARSNGGGETNLHRAAMGVCNTYHALCFSLQKTFEALRSDRESVHCFYEFYLCVDKQFILYDVAHAHAPGKDLRIKGRRADREWTIDEVFKLMKGKSDAYLLKKDDSENTCVHITCMEGGAAARAILKEWYVFALCLLYMLQLLYILVAVCFRPFSFISFPSLLPLLYIVCFRSGECTHTHTHTHTRCTHIYIYVYIHSLYKYKLMYNNG